MVSVGGDGLVVTSWGWHRDENTDKLYRLWRVRKTGKDLMGLIAPEEVSSTEALLICYDVLKDSDD